MPVLLVGCGRMGGAMARGWAGREAIFVHDPLAERLPEGARRVEALEPLSGEDLVVVLAVKPQIFGTLGPSLRPLAESDALFVSIMAGITLAGLSEALGGAQRIVRAMPNTPAAIGRGITAAAAGPAITPADRARVDQLLAPTGALLWLDDEGQMDAVTAVSGSGPAYFFRFAEALARAGEGAGLPPPVAMQLARATFTGAAALAEQECAELAALRQQVTSPGGTTAAGLGEMDRGDAVDRLAAAVVDAAAARSRELAR
jgi:pyrroline-5-carboxylate reductase